MSKTTFLSFPIFKYWILIFIMANKNLFLFFWIQKLYSRRSVRQGVVVGCMKNYCMNYCMSIIKDSKSYSNERLEEIEYGLEAIYILITKSIVIFTLAYFLNILIPLLIFMVIYNIIRMPSFGLHATKSIYCLISSVLIFIGGTYLCVHMNIPFLIKIGIGIYCIIRVFQNAPADTYKRPIVNPKRREVYKTLSTIIAIGFVFLSLTIPSNFIANAFLVALGVQVCIISPYVYKLFHLPYDNYKTYIMNNGLNESLNIDDSVEEVVI